VLCNVIQLEDIAMIKAIMKFISEEEGLTTVEYAIAGGLVGAAVIVAFTDLGAAVGGVVNIITGDHKAAAGP
jgi:pilus assembly protein Flp/PilA